MYEPFDAASARIDAHERIIEDRWVQLERRLTHIESVLDRVERRMWIAMSGMSGFLAADVAYTFFVSTN
ncbi:MAG: hypothetical protein AAF245_04970 [Pseudomonadota bacterium]